MNKLPFDIIINHIIPYTYNVQSKSLLDDIVNYNEVKTMLLYNPIYDSRMITHKMFAIFYTDPQALQNILRRHISCKSKQCGIDTLRKYQTATRCNILLGLFTADERQKCLEYICNNENWFVI